MKKFVSFFTPVLLSLLALLSACTTNFTSLKKQLDARNTRTFDHIVHTGPVVYHTGGREMTINMEKLPADYTGIVRDLARANLKEMNFNGNLIVHSGSPINPTLKQPLNPIKVFGAPFSSKLSRFWGESEPEEIVTRYGTQINSEIVFIYQIMGITGFGPDTAILGTVSVFDVGQKKLLARTEIERTRLKGEGELTENLVRKRESVALVRAQFAKAHDAILVKLNAADAVALDK